MTSSSGELLNNAVKDIYLKPARLLIKKCLLEMDSINIQLQIFDALIRKAYKGERKRLLPCEYDKLLEPYDRLRHFVSASSTRSVRKGLAKVVKAKKFSRGWSDGHSFEQTKIPKDLLEFLKEEVKDVH